MFRDRCRRLPQVARRTVSRRPLHPVQVLLHMVSSPTPQCRRLPQRPFPRTASTRPVHMVTRKWVRVANRPQSRTRIHIVRATLLPIRSTSSSRCNNNSHNNRPLIHIMRNIPEWIVAAVPVSRRCRQVRLRRDTRPVRLVMIPGTVRATRRCSRLIRPRLTGIPVDLILAVSTDDPLRPHKSMRTVTHRTGTGSRRLPDSSIMVLIIRASDTTAGDTSTGRICRMDRQLSTRPPVIRCPRLLQCHPKTIRRHRCLSRPRPFRRPCRREKCRRRPDRDRHHFPHCTVRIGSNHSASRSCLIRRQLVHIIRSSSSQRLPSSCSSPSGGS